MGALALRRAPFEIVECLYQERRLAHQERQANRIVPHVIERAPFRHE